MALHIISLGGSLIVPDEIDTSYLYAFRQLILQRLALGDRFILVAGGGKIARKYQAAAAHISAIDDEEKDWLGIHSTRLNAHLLRTIFKPHAHPVIFKDFDHDHLHFEEQVLVGAGWKPGWSTDYIAVLLAKKFQGQSVINLSNIAYVYEEDPRVNPKARKFERISWEAYRKIVGSHWSPGMSSPFDPVASQEAESLLLKVAIMNGKDFGNLHDYLEGKPFKGTLIG